MSLLKKLALAASGVGLGLAMFFSSGLVNTAFAQSPGLLPVYPDVCPVDAPFGVGVTSECHYYDYIKSVNDDALKSFQFAVVMGLLNAMQFFTQQIAINTAQWMLNGFQGQGTAFYNQTFGSYLASVALNSANQFLSSINTYTSSQFGFNICSPITINLKLALGIGNIATLPPPNCTFQTIATNFESTYRSLQPENLATTMKQSIQPGGNGISMTLSTNQSFLNQLITDQQSNILQRQEGGGLLPITDFISGQIQTPANVAKDTIQQTNAINLLIGNQRESTNALAFAAFQAGLKQIPIIAASTFVNTLAVGLLQKFFSALNSSSQLAATADLTNPNAQTTGAPVPVPVAISDIVTPNLLSTSKEDFLFDLSTCNTDQRGTWGCSLDSGFVAALQSVTDSGGYTIARAAGIGAEGPSGGNIFLHSDWQLIPESDAADNQDPNCYQRAYCSSNLAKLRFARIISIGWELAANSPFNAKTNGEYVTLGQVVSGFNNCNANGEIDAQHPWCHLINPGWVLTEPQFQCNLQGYGDTIIGSSGGTASPVPSRIQECEDVVSCLQRDDHGNCIGGYGYCLSERPVWRFGADECDQNFVSCRTYSTRDKSISLTGANAGSNTNSGPQVSYLRNTIDYGSCNADNIGCQYYFDLRDTSTTATDQWVGDKPVSTSLYNAQSIYTDGNKSLVSPRVYFDATVQTCDAGDDGCTKVYDVQPGQSAFNFIQNGSFETVSPSDPTLLTGWSDAGSVHYSFTNFVPSTDQSASSLYGGQASFDGSQSVSFGATQPTSWQEPIKQRVTIAPLRNYVLSFYARTGDGGAPPQANVAAFLKDKDGKTVSASGSFYRATDCTTDGLSPGGDFYDIGQTANTRPAVSSSGQLTQTWTRFTCEFVSNSDAQYADIVVRGDDVAIDAVQLEEGSQAAPFVDGDNLNLPVDYLKIPPPELACSGSSQDRSECANYARVCSQAAAGCQGYTDTGGGDPTEIPASLNANDYCPGTCVGYADYLKQPSAFDLTKSANPVLNDPDDQTSADFIPTAAQQCSAQAAGCTEFTNIESAGNGGEQTLFLTYARACEKPSDLTRTYFTWEGSDTAGYQLRTWSLVASAPVATAPPKIIQKSGPDGVFKDPSMCNEASWKTGADPDCRQFYDAQGDVFYIYYSQTVVSSTDCHDYRKDDSDLADCQNTGGDYDQGTKECVYHILAAESTMCAAQDNDCRAFIGTTGRNTVSVYQENFASASGTLFTVPAGATAKIGYSTESLQVGDYSLKVSNASNQPNLADTYTSFPSATNTLYTLSFWAKTTDASHPTVSVKMNDGTQVVGTFVLQTDWTRYEIGPFKVNANKATSTIGWWGLPNSPNTTYLDTVNIQRLQDVVYVKNNSWVVPAECDQTATGVPQPQAMLGCRQYTDRNGKTVDVHQFSQLCQYSNIGCTGYVDTQNSDNPYSQTFAEQGSPTGPRPWDDLFSGGVTTTRAEDSYIYLIDEPSAHCDASNMSCRAFGQPQYDENQKVTGVKTIYLKDDVTQYVDPTGEPQMLCRPSELFCDRFTSQTANPPVISYFRDPGTHTCTWQDKVEMAATNGTYNGQTYSIPEGEYSGWFVDGAASPTPCDPTELSAGNTFLNDYSAAPKYAGFVSTCPSDQAECTEFRDPNDHSDIEHPLGRSYYFLDNEHLDKTSCAGSVSPFDGCVLFRDMNDSELTYSVAASYADSHANDDSPVTPVDCTNDPTNPNCSGVTGVCDNNNSKSCTKDSDCSGSGKCELDDANLILKVKLDRDCQTWLGCATGETVYDPGQQQYVDLCENLAVCDELGANDSSYCGHYLDRTPGVPVTKSYTSNGFYEPILRQGVFLDAVTYAKRPVDFGSPDYSSYALPNHFQIADTLTRPVGYDLLTNYGNIKYDYFHDYRDVAAVPFCNNVGVNGYVGCANKYSDQNFPKLNLCQQQQTGQIGYFVTTDKPEVCYLSIETPYAQNVNDYLEQPTGINPDNAQNTATLFSQLADPTQDQFLSDAYPPAECKAYPSPNAPFPNSYVTAWDFTKDPPQPQTFVDGYDGVPYCEYGEDCSCSYRDVSYGGEDKYYSLYGGSSPEGVCVGGTNDGEACVPSSEIASTNSNTVQSPTAEPSAPNATPPATFCGAGTCQAVQNVTFVRGIYGQCLERDTARIVAGSQSYNPCLVWSPAPVLFGQNDVYHYEPTAGYLPPQNSGEYYCVSNALPPKDLAVPAFVPDTSCDSGDQGDNGYCVQNPDLQWIVPPGEIAASTDHDYDRGGNGFNYDEDFVSDGDCFACAGSDSTFIDGQTALGGDMGTQCEDADDSEDDIVQCTLGGSGFTCTAPNGFIDLSNDGASHLANDYAGRWITTGRGLTHNYAEYFIPLSKVQWAQWLLNKTSDPGAQADDDAMLERNFAYFNFNAIPDPGDGIIGCGYSQDWVDGVTVSDYDDDDQIKQGTSSWISAFNANFTHAITPDTAAFLDDSNGALERIPCVYSRDYDNGTYNNNVDTDQSCYIKYWQLGYQDSGQPEFEMQQTAMGGPHSWSESNNPGNPGTTFYQTAAGSKPYFAIRAVFEDSSPSDNAQPSADEDPTGNGLAGPFRFVGFWVTAATPGITSERAIYMTLNIGHADICEQVAQVVAPDTRNAAPFMDRIWSSTSFDIPLLGVTYSTVNPPFGSAKNTEPIGKSPLFQTAGNQPGTQSVLRPPTWIASGATYFTPTQSPVNNWGWLTDLFAKVYRVYQFYDQPVSKTSWLCVAGPHQGTWCPDLTDYYNPKTNPHTIGSASIDNTGAKIGSQYCGFVGTCDSTQVDPSTAQPLCNALSGVNRGLPCGSDLNNPTTGYGVCHNAPMKLENGVLTPQYTRCVMAAGWQDDSTGSSYHPTSAQNITLFGNNSFTGQQAADRGALHCASDAVKYPDGTTPLCTQDSSKIPGGLSTQCPIEVDPGNGANQSACIDIDSSTGEGHCSNGYERAACVTNNDCRFTWKEWWDNGKQSPQAYDLMDQYAEYDQSDDTPTRGQVEMDLKTTVSNIEANASNPALWDDFKTFCLDPSGSQDYLLHPQGQDSQNSGPNEQFNANDDDFSDIDYSQPQYQGFNPLLAQFCAAAFFHGGMTPLNAVAHNVGPIYAEDYTTGGGDNLFGTADFPMDAAPYAQGLMTDAGGNSDGNWTIAGNVWWDDRTIVDDSTGIDYTAGPSTDDPQGSNGDKDIGKNNLEGGRYLFLTHSSASSLAFPGAFEAAEYAGNSELDQSNGFKSGVFIPGHCERPPVTPPNGFDDPTSQLYASGQPADGNYYYYDAPYYKQTFGFEASGPGSVIQRYYSSAGQGWTPGVCAFGELEGSPCNSDPDCAKPGYDKNAQAESWAYCEPASVPDAGGNPVPSAWNGFNVTGNPETFSWTCALPANQAGSAASTDLDTDDNACTHNAGYYPDAAECGGDSSREECLTGIEQNSAKSYNPATTPLPTDVTAGLYTPLYLGKDPNTYNQDYSYVSYYTPIPPTIAAPDTKQSCPAPGQCPIALVNTFSLENQAEGKVAYVGGQALATINFYGWAADNQAPLTDVWVDWGDKQVQQISDAKMKNKKPFCGGTSECEFVPGLTCNSDADCPPAAGKCVAVGFCNAKPYVSCKTDDDCNTNPIPGQPGDSCVTHATFGSSTDDCEQNYFSFTHAYSCGTQAEIKDAKVPVCAGDKYCSNDRTQACSSNSDCSNGGTCTTSPGKGYCSRDNSVACSVDSECAPGDKCLTGLAPPGGCYDPTNNACRFTPRVELEDSWGWCTGECRIENLGGGNLGSGFTGSGSTNDILFQNGGCYDGTGIYKNTDTAGNSPNNTPNYEVATQNGKSLQNTCDSAATAGTNYRPWIVYDGALQLGVTP